MTDHLRKKLESRSRKVATKSYLKDKTPSEKRSANIRKKMKRRQ